ncbi:trafficking kinesin-binding protein milt [Ctenocephalides felis]|uniref:trafficking kinesin-binding protein milt n=1 Tax=Ctenocephalides felis TaxID=7515 RepID=UPI000E6E2519|nr:trafficking kinesin-binding protein milt [Ctenocephalides felis]XP_026462345.1 trafficking kinesin-binding protein milt [Ctenocephalides felis]XP_026462346.1 trafficking kinesin-binding protein milt [Ctenocephalides felis]XP_026462347.1 trafficking kinesin-binding protein milt [Ctenocephalides felis]XP_026462348.1 trafficking kinesin-binding protein milt [Ctenocephalides felis]
MTKTYNDIEAVTRLLEEKEKDLELTARIGQQLLARTGTLEARVTELEAELKCSNERAAQLAHDLAAKSELVRVLASDQDGADSADGGDDELDSPTGELKLSGELLRRKLRQLEQDNRALRGEAARLLQDTDACEEAEARLLKDFTAQLSNANLEVDALHEELEKQKEENRLQNERILYLTEKLNEAELRLHNFSAENEHMTTILNVTRENQTSLASELAEFKERHAEAMALLRDAQEQLRRQRRKAAPAVRGCGIMPSLIYANGGGAQPDSLQSELESSLYSELSMDSGISGTGLTPDYKKVFNTVQCASKNSADTQNFATLQPNYDQTIMSSSNQPRMSSFQSASSNRSSMYSNSTQGLVYLDSPAMSDTEELYPGAPVAGVPGIPGAADLSDALRRLTPAEVMTRRAVLSGGPLYADYDYDNLGGGCGPITGWRTPDSVMSTGGSSSGVSSRHSGGTSSGVGGSMWRPPRDVLQLVKPMEGSHTLRHWSRLATPTLAGLLEERPGVQIRGGRGLDELGMELYTLSDLEEDDDISLPGKRFQNSGCVYTYTNSTVMHPDDGSICGTSEYGSRLCSVQPTPGTQTPAPRTRSNSTCSTFSTNMGLASVLNERGMQSGVPSCFNTPASVRGGMFSTSTTNGQDYTPTATPCNSPDGSPIATPRCSSPEPVSPHAGIASLLSQGADLLWRTFGTGLYPEKSIEHHDLSPSDTKSVSSIGLVDSVKRLGLESLIIPPGDTIDNRYGYNEPLSLHLRGAGSVVTRRNDAGPMARLASIRAALKEAEAHSEGAPRVQPETPKESKDSASPKAAEVASPSPRRARGGAAADRRARMRERRITRTDLGTVVPTGAKVKKDQEAPTTTSTEEAPRRSAFGAIGALLFGRKGGLL